MRVSHAVRTPDECIAESRKGLSTLTALLDARLLEGNAELAEQAREAAMEIARKDRRSFAEGLLAEQIERDRKFGTVWRTIQPDLKQSVGGLRDVQVARWLGAVDAAGVPEEVEPALDFLLRVRVALHLNAGRGSNRLAAEHHAAVAASLGYPDVDGWETRDALMRDVFAAGRRIHGATLESGANEGRSRQPRSLEEFLRRSLAEPASLLHPRATESVRTVAAIGAAWSRVQGRPQRDPYHRYPVDVHLLQTVGETAALVHHPQEPFAAEAVRSLGNPETVLLGALLHDIGKVGEGSHVPAGLDVAREVLDRMGTEERLRDDVLFLVGEHLLLADTATRRNLEEEDLIVQVAARIGDRRRLAMLYLLTMADAMATGPSASTPWRMALIRDLVAKVDHVFERGQMDRDRAGRLTAAEAAVQEALTEAGIEEHRVGSFLRAVPPDYLLWIVPDQAARHIDLILPSPAEDEARTDFRPGRSPGTYQVAVGAVDRLGLLAAVAGSFTLAGLTILSAQAFTTERGIALDIFEVRGAFEDELDDRRWKRFHRTLDGALSGRIDLTEHVRSLRSHYPTKTKDVTWAVRVDQEVSDFFTVVEVGGPDRLGLLFDLARTFSDYGVDVHVAKVATYGPRVVDVFYVRDEQGQKLEDPSRIGGLVRALSEAASGG